MAWYKTGTVALINGSAVVTGTGTNWLALTGVAQVSNTFIGPDRLPYEIAQINSATELVLADAYEGASVGTSVYAIQPTMGLTADLAKQAGDLIAAANEAMGQLWDAQPQAEAAAASAIEAYDNALDALSYKNEASFARNQSVAAAATSTNMAADAQDARDVAVAKVDASDDRLYPGVYSTPPTNKPRSGLPCAEGDRCTILIGGVVYEHLFVGGGWLIPNIDATALQSDAGGTLVKQVFFIGADPRDMAAKMRDQGMHLFDLVTSSTEQDAIKAGISALDLTDKLHDAFDLIGNYSQGGTFRLPNGVSNSGPQIMPPKLCLIGDQPPGFQERAVVADISGTVLRTLPGQTAPLLRNAHTGFVRNPSSEVDGLPQHYSNAVLQNLTLLQCEDAPDARATLLELERAWNVQLQNVNFNARYRGGLVLRVHDCNTLRLRNCNAIGAVFWESVADSQWVGGEIGSVEGRCWSTLWLSGKCWQDKLISLFAYNNAQNVAAPSWTFATVGTTLVLSGAHWLQDESPVILTSTGVLPTELAEGKTYYVKRLSTTEVALAASRRNVRDGVYIALSGGVGSHTIQMGKNTGIYINDGTHEVGLTGIRSDQNYGNAILFDAAHRNTVTNLDANQCGRGNPTGQAALAFINGASNNAISSGQINGTASETGPGNQTIGIYEDASSAGRNHFGDALVVKGHSAGNYVSPKYTGEVHSVSMPIGAFVATQGSPELTVMPGGGRIFGWKFDAAADEIIGAGVSIPVGWSRIRIGLLWANAGAGSGNVLWSANIGHYGVGDDVTSGSDSVASVNINSDVAAAGAQSTAVFSRLDVISTFRVVPGDLLRMRIKRTGSAVTDTLPNDAALLAVTLERLDD